MVHIGFFAFNNCQAIDLVGPLEVFNKVNEHLDVPCYKIHIIGPSSAPIRTSSGLTVEVEHSYNSNFPPLDTLFVCGGPESGIRKIMNNSGVLCWLKTQSNIRRLASVCTGAFILAEADMLHDRRATTHWRGCALLMQEYPSTRIDDDALFVKDGNIYTSAGITAGNDLALSMVEEDHGRELSMKVALDLVLYLRRPANQSQLSGALQAQFLAKDKIKIALDWALANLTQNLCVDNLAAKANMSPRNFARIFKKETGSTPAKVIEAARVQRAKELLGATDLPLERIADVSGFGSAETLRRIFNQAVRMAPGVYRKRSEKVYAG